jgi:hypothetical protein
LLLRHDFGLLSHHLGEQAKLLPKEGLSEAMPEVLLPRAGLSWEMPGLFLWRSARTCHHPVATQISTKKNRAASIIAGVYIFEAGSAGWTGMIEFLPAQFKDLAQPTTREQQKAKVITPPGSS